MPTKRLFALLLLMVGCATSPQPHTAAQDALVGRGPWSEVPAVEMPTGDTSLPISLLRDVADALLELPGDYPAAQVWVVGYVHNHPCGSPPSSADLGTWPTDAFDPYVAMAEVRLVPGNPASAFYKNTPIEMASALVAERQDGTRIILRYFPTGEIQQWSTTKADWVALGTCAPSATTSRDRTPRCNQPLRLLRE